MTVKGRAEQIKKLIKEGKTASEIGVILDMDRSNVYNYCKYHKIKLPVLNPRPSGAYATKGGRFVASVKYDNNPINLGTFDTKRRAELSVELWKYWCKQGFKPWAVPSKPKNTSLLW